MIFAALQTPTLRRSSPSKPNLFAQNGRQARLHAGFQPMRINFFLALRPRRISMEDFVTPK